MSKIIHGIPDHGEFTLGRYSGSAFGADWYDIEFDEGPVLGIVTANGSVMVPKNAFDPEWIETHVEAE